jgi:hypothetical protein
MMKTIYLLTLNWADKEFFFIFLYIANLEKTWQNSSNINSRIELKALINSIRSNINSRIEFKLLFEIRLYDQTMSNHLNRLNQSKLKAKSMKKSLQISLSFIQTKRSIMTKMTHSFLSWQFFMTCAIAQMFLNQLS